MTDHKDKSKNMEHDKELGAINKILAAISGLEDSVRVRALKYVLERFGISPVDLGSVYSPSLSPLYSKASDVPPQQTLPPNVIRDIRTLKEEKNPKSAIQMAVLVAYYLQEVAPTNERKEFIDTNDIERYFKQAGYRLPAGKNGAADTLNNAKNSGYLEGVGRGTCKLNPVGYNLIAYGLPESTSGHEKKKTNKRKKGKASRK